MTELHPQLQRDCLTLGRFQLCRLLLMRDANYPWFILVPDREDVREIHELACEDRLQLMRESSALAQVLAHRFAADKLNIAALGNVVPQLHIHHIVRYRNDPAWPDPVWGKAPAKPYSQEAIEAVIVRLKAGLTNGFTFSL